MATYTRANSIDNIAASTLKALACICNDDLQVRIFVKDLFYTAVVTSFLPWYYSAPLLIIIILVIVT